MEKLLRMALEGADQAEVFCHDSQSTELATRDGRVTSASSSISSGVALRIIRSGRMGFAYTKNLSDRAELVRNAQASLSGNVEAGYVFPGRAEMPPAPPFDDSVEKMGYRDILEPALVIHRRLSGRVKAQVSANGGFGVSRIRILNSSGFDGSYSTSGWAVGGSIHYPGTESAIGEHFLARCRIDPDTALIDRLAGLFEKSLPEIEVKPGRMRVIFTPWTMYTLIWRLKAATAGRAFHTKTTPLLESMGKKVLSEMFTLVDDPLDPASVSGARPFDDEGVPCSRRVIFEKGVFKGIYNNLDYAARLGMEPTGNGTRGGGMMGGSDPVASLPGADMQALQIAPGDASFEEIVAGTERGLLLFGVLGAHSGNIVNGDFSVGADPGLYIEKGRIVGRIKDGMLAGNAFEVLSRVSAVQSGPFNPSGFVRYPCVACEDVSVTGRNR
ncbi:TldD/PmbA family protein [Candidatus Fermentibacteria bacterium]|nr:TldD/PmbA family protein [Candidatus Fermentibacteria bacterium]